MHKETLESHTGLPFDLFSCPTSSFHSPRSEILVGSSFTAHGSQPVGAEVVIIFPIWKSLGYIAGSFNQYLILLDDELIATHPMTPIEDRSKASVRLGSW